MEKTRLKEIIREEIKYLLNEGPSIEDVVPRKLQTRFRRLTGKRVSGQKGSDHSEGLYHLMGGKPVMFTAKSRLFFFVTPVEDAENEYKLVGYTADGETFVKPQTMPWRGVDSAVRNYVSNYASGSEIVTYHA